MIDKPGVYTMTAEEYHKDPVVEPSLSSGIARTIISKSPLHGWTEHPRLNPNFEPEEKEKFDYGSAVHALLLEGDDRMVVLPYDSYMKKDAKEARDAARAAGKHPILEAKYPKVLKMREVALAALAACKDLKGVTLATGKAEQTLVWWDSERSVNDPMAPKIWLRARPDFMHGDDRRLLLDYKSTEASAEPDAWTRTIMGMGGDVQAAHYLEGNEGTGGAEAEDTRFIFWVQETEAPFACSFVGASPMMVDLGRRKLAVAKRAWAKCMASGEWPCYPDKVCWIEPRTWDLQPWEGTEAAQGRGIPYDPGKMWEKPKKIAQETDPA